MVITTLFSTAFATMKLSTSCSESRWPYFDANLLTCRVNMRKIITQFSIISSPNNMSVTAISIKNEKDIEFIPVNIDEKYPNLIAFQARNCSIGSLNEHIFNNLSDLKLINLAHNKIITVGNNIFDDQNMLEYLELGCNLIEFISSDAFHSLENLKQLFLNDNQIQWLGEELLLGKNNLEHITLKSNQIKMLNWDGLSSLQNLKNVSFSFNLIEEIRYSAIIKNENVERIWLKGNKIRYLDYHIFEGMKNLKQLDLKDNICINRSYFNVKLDYIVKDLKAKFIVENCVFPTETSKARIIFSLNNIIGICSAIFFRLWNIFKNE